MFDRSRAPRLPVLAVAALLLVLGLLAALQYRWVDQVGEAERARLQAGARTRVGQLAQDFDREVTRAFAWLQVDADMLGPDGGARYAARYDRWAARTEHLGLVSAVYVTVAGEASPRLRRFDPAARDFVDAEWPADLAGLREKLEASEHEGGPRPDREGGPRPEHGGAMRGPFGFVLEEGPALVTPILAADARGEGPGEGGRGEAGRGAEHERSERPGGRFHPAGHVIILFDRGYIQRELLPALASRYFTSGGEFDYCVVVTSRRDAHAVVYRSDPDDGAHPAPDATAGILEVRFDQLEAALPRGGDPAAPAPAFLSRRPAREGWRGSPRPLPYVDRGLWEVGVTHRSGSLEQVVARTRHRNLMISFGTLLLLGASAAMVLVSAQRARHLAAQQVEFVAGVSHELRTPVAVVCSAGENLADGLVRDPADVRVYGATIRDEGRRLSEMIEQVLEYAGIAAREGRRKGETVEVASLVQDAVKSCAAVLAEAGIALETRVPPGLPRLAGDRAALRRALQNLIQNAAKHAAAGRWIGVSAEVSGAGRGGRVRLSVRDRGTGIAAGEESRIFQAFYRGKQALSAGISGSGLGLSLVQRIVESHGGQVEVENTPGGGCAFTLVLPAQATAAATVAPVGEKDAQANPAR
jgi:signal transduction histidine kinase